MKRPTVLTKSEFNCDESRLIAIAHAFAQTLRGGEILFLEGALGAGKTTFTRALLRGRGWNAAVASPSFPLVQQYATPPLAWIHADLYRLDTKQDSPDLDDQLDFRDGLGRAPTVTVIEWASLFPMFRQTVITRAHHAGIKPIEVVLEIVPETADTTNASLRNVKMFDV